MEQRHLLLCNRSAALMKMGRYADAATDARGAMQDAPEGFVKAHYRLACALRGGGDNAGALRACDEALQIWSGNDQLKALRELCMHDISENATPTVASDTPDQASAAASARGGMLQRARAKKGTAPSAAEPVEPTVFEAVEPVAPARSGMLERARAKKQGT